MGVALTDLFSKDPNYSLEGKNSRDFDAGNLSQVSEIIEKNKPDIVINAVALVGIDPCEKEPSKAFQLNTLYPKVLAGLSKKYGFILVHFSSDAVFNDEKNGFYTERDTPTPVSLYGVTKYGGDCFVQSLTPTYYIVRTSVLFGETPRQTQFVEKMLQRVHQGESQLRIADDIVGSPTYSKDVALKIKEMLDEKVSFGIYHVANEGRASLYELMEEIIANLQLNVTLQRASYRDFHYLGMKNTRTPILSEKIAPLRPWKSAVKAYCNCLGDYI